MSDKLEKFKDVLREVFQMDQAELDFGIYRIMNQKRDEIEKFIDADLLPKVKQLLEQNRRDDSKIIKEELELAIKNAENLGFDPNTVPKVRELQERYSSEADTTILENDIFSHLTNFFRRYYDNGDFISQRRYKKDVYAIPYEGEEVKLYWANYDQYYIKTTEYFKNYSFKLSDGKIINFVLIEAATEQNNNRTANGKERRFFLREENPIDITNNELNIYFHYDIKDSRQKELNEASFQKIKTMLPVYRSEFGKGSEFIALFDRRPTAKNPNRTLLEKHINDYTARNTFDYFIHKDLGGFLRRELDFYIKNEVLYIDDLNELDEKQLHRQVSTIKVIKQVGHKIIAFLEQIENFQKKLWLKKKFVVETNYCITLDRVPRELWNEIITNTAQLEEWKKLFAIDEIEGDLEKQAYTEPLNEKFLEQNSFLVLDTVFFDESFKDRLLKNINNLDEQTNGLLIHSENFQALNLLLERYKEKVKSIYIDPPYNAKSSEILYKNTFKHASWLSLMENRLYVSKYLLDEDSSCTIAIDENEQENLGQILAENFPNCKKTCVTIVHNPGGIQGTNFSYTHEYAYFIFPNVSEYIGKVKRDDADIVALRDWGGEESKRETAKNCFYPILVKDKEVVGFGQVLDDDIHPTSANVIKEDGIIEIYPIDGNGVERKWRYARQTVESIKDELKCDEIDGELVIRRYKSIYHFKTVWSDKLYNSNTYGSKLLSDILGNNKFTFPKSLYNVQDCIDATTQNSKNALLLDFFAGSGTTAHAVINLNKKDGGKRKYILVEMGEYFDPVTKPRIQKVIYSKDWRDGKPVSCDGISHCFKYLRLESYEDTLNNLAVTRTQEQQQSLDMNEEFREGYMLSYMLDVETEGSSSLLNIDKFEDPFNYFLNISRNNETKPLKIDLIETFNYLTGLVVEKIDESEGYKIITGKNLAEEKILIIWRNLKEKDNNNLNEFFCTLTDTINTSELNKIYVNGANYLEKLKLDQDKWKVILIEEEFKKRMFENIEV